MPSITDIEFIHHLNQNHKTLGNKKNNRRSKSRRISDELFRYLVDGMNEGVIIINNDGVIIYVNENFCHMLGCTYEDLTGKEVTDFIESSSRAKLQAKLTSCMASTPKSVNSASIKVTWNSMNGQTIFSQVSPQMIAVDNLQAELFFAVVTDITDSVKARESLIQSKRELHFLSKKLLTTQEMERKRIAGELHDGIGQCLSAIKFKIEELLGNNDEGRHNNDSLKVLIPLLQNATAEVRRIAMDLRPSILDDLGLKSTISWLTREFSAIYPGIEFESNFEIEEADLSDNLKTVLYRVIQESLSNICKHAMATKVLIKIEKKQQHLELSIKDNGVGLFLDDNSNSAHASIGLGLSSMKGRVEFTNGDFAIKSSAGQGTEILARWLWCPPK